MTSSRNSLGDIADRRPLTVLFCDLVDSVHLSSSIDPEDLRALLASYRRACDGPIERFGGFVARYIGDGILAYFGYPSAHEDDAERAINAALDVLAQVGELNTSERAGLDQQLAVRIGIASGPVVVGKMGGAADAAEVEVTGEAPNLAARLHALASPGSIVVDVLTRELAHGRFQYAPLGPLRLKGFEKAVSAWRVLGQRSTTRFEARRRQRTPLVGREKQQQLLLRCWQDVVGGRGRVALICGRAGVGKSRLAEATRELVVSGTNQTRAVAIRFQCSPYHSNAALHPVISTLERLARIDRDDSESTRLGKLERLLRQNQFSNPQNAAALIRDLVNPFGEALTQGFRDKSAIKRRQLGLLQQWIAEAALERPLLTIWEDIQWIDPTSRQLLDQLIAAASTSRIFVLTTIRTEPGLDHSTPAGSQFSEWISRSDVTMCVLDELKPGQGETIAKYVAGGKSISPRMLEAIVRRAQGNPLYIEELTRALIAGEASPERPSQRSAWHSSSTIPDSLSGVLMARVDRTGPLREIALHAAVVGEGIQMSLLSSVMRVPPAHIGEALERLAELDVLTSSRTSGERIYDFKHELVQEAAYASLLKSRRREIHHRVATAMAGQGATGGEFASDLIGQHYAKAGDAENAIRHWRLASERAMARSAHQEAANILQRALDLLPGLSDDGYRRTTELDLVRALARALQSVRGFAAPETEAQYLRARDLCDAYGNTGHAFEIEWGLFLARLVKGQLSDAEKNTERMFTLARHDHPSELSDAHLARGMVRMNAGQFRLARLALTRGMDLLVDGPDSPIENPLGQLAWNFCASQLSFALWFEGFGKSSLDLVGRNIEIARAHLTAAGRAYNYVATLVWAVRVHQCRRDVEQVRLLTNEIISISRKFGYAYYEAQATAYLGWATAATDRDPERGIAMMHSGISALKFAKTELGLRGHLIHLGETLCKLGRKAEAEEALGAAGGETGGGTRCWDAEFVRVRALMNFLGPGRDEVKAEADFRRSLEIAREQNAKALELRTAITYARHLMSAGRAEEGRSLLKQVLVDLPTGEDDDESREARVLLT